MHYFCVLVCCTGSAVYVFSRVTCKEISKIGPELKILHSKAHFSCLKQINSLLKVYIKYQISLHAALTILCSSARKHSGSNSL